MESLWDFLGFIKNKNVLNNAVEPGSLLSLAVVEAPRQSKTYII